MRSPGNRECRASGCSKASAENCPRPWIRLLRRDAFQPSRRHHAGFNAVVLRIELVTQRLSARLGGSAMNILWIILIGFIAGLIARLLAPGPNNPTGFILTTVLGIAGAFLATFIGQSIGWYRLDHGAGLIGATVGAVVVLFIWHRLVVNRAISDPGTSGSPGPRRYL